ncbi:MAG: hypothetical protein L0Y80_06370 [Ignavibacteriae bacterium]|nr:hypothetical protein [Ignavibacteriota bacterium]
MNKGKQLFLATGIILELVAVILLAKSEGSTGTGVVFLAVGLVFLIIGITRKPQPAEKQPEKNT